MEGELPAGSPPRPRRPRCRGRPPARLPVPDHRRTAAAARRRRRLPRLRRGAGGGAPARRTTRRGWLPRRHPVRRRTAGGLRLLAPAGHADRLGADPARRGRRTGRPATPSTTPPWPVSTPWPRRGPSRSTSPCSTPPERDDELPPVRRRTPPDAVRQGRRGGQGATSWPATSSRWCSPSASSSSSTPTPSTCTGRCARSIPAPTCTSCATRSCAWSGSSPEPMVQLTGGRVISRPIAGTRRRGRTDEHDRRLAAELIEHPKERAEHVMLVDLARNDVGRVVRVRHRAGRRADDAGALQPRHAPDLAGVGAPAARLRARSTCCGPPCRPAPSRARRRCGPWRSSTSSSRPSGARTPG